jgi:hypothetical protein
VFHLRDRASGATDLAEREESLKGEDTEMRQRLADLMPDFPARASLLAANLPSPSWLSHVILQQNTKTLFE